MQQRPRKYQIDTYYHIDPELEPFGVIYVIRNKVNGHIYVGQQITKHHKYAIKAKDIQYYRWQEHVWAQTKADHNKYPWTARSKLYRQLRKYGWQNFELHVIQYAMSKPALDSKEKYWIKRLNAATRENYNSTLGGDGSWGRIVSEETRRKISQANKGRMPLLRSQKVVQINLDTMEFHVFYSIAAAQRALDINESAIRQVLYTLTRGYYIIKKNKVKCRRFRHKNYVFCYYDDWLQGRCRDYPAREQARKRLAGRSARAPFF